jgi:hypothetical protein
MFACASLIRQDKNPHEAKTISVSISLALLMVSVLAFSFGQKEVRGM